MRHFVLIELVAEGFNSRFIVVGVGNVQPLIGHFGEMSLESRLVILTVNTDEKHLQFTVRSGVTLFKLFNKDSAWRDPVSSDINSEKGLASHILTDVHFRAALADF